MFANENRSTRTDKQLSLTVLKIDIISFLERSTRRSEMKYMKYTYIRSDPVSVVIFKK